MYLYFVTFSSLEAIQNTAVRQYSLSRCQEEGKSISFLVMSDYTAPKSMF